MSDDHEILYRYDIGYGGYLLMKLPVVRRTHCGAWVNFYGEEKFILNNARKRFAYPNKELAFESFLRRKKKQLAILGAQHDAVKALIELAETAGAVDDSVKLPDDFGGYFA